MARRKKTDPIEQPDELPELTPQQQEFVRLILEGKTASDAYRGSYDCSNMQPNSIWCEASKLRRHTNVAQWLSAARQAKLGQGIVTLDSHTLELERLREIALETGNVGAAVQAEQLRGKAQGLYVDKIEDITQHDPMKTLEAIAELSPELAEKLARENGLTWHTRH